MVNVKATDGTNNVDVTGKGVFAVVIAPEDREANAQAISMGCGSVMEIMPVVASMLGSTLSQMVVDPIKRSMVMMAMLDAFRDATFGHGTDIRVVKKQVTPVEEGKDDNK